MHLRFQLPGEVLPLQIEKARLSLKINAPGRQVTVAGRTDRGPIELTRVHSPLDALRLDITQEQLLHLDPEGGLYLDLTGLGCFRKDDVPAWYDAADEEHRWAAQAKFWDAVAGRCASSPAVFCYDLRNEPRVRGDKLEGGKGVCGQLGPFYFLECVTLEPRGRTRDIRNGTPEILRSQTS